MSPYRLVKQEAWTFKLPNQTGFDAWAASITSLPLLSPFSLFSPTMKYGIHSI